MGSIFQNFKVSECLNAAMSDYIDGVPCLSVSETNDHRIPPHRNIRHIISNSAHMEVVSLGFEKANI